ncbi:MAG: hypothetical protein C0501_10715 [Isosphaera sp.]|nr:hypothetical protein [Isosphaera sp.]
MAPDDDDLAAFQAALLDLLDRNLPAEELRRRLRDDPAFAAFRGYVETFEPRMLAVAADLVKKWGRRSGSGEDQGGRPG